MSTPGEILEKATRLAKDGKFEQAYDLFVKAYEKDPECIQALYGQGAVLYKNKNYAQAREVFSRVLDKDPFHSRAVKYLHRCDDALEQMGCSASPPPLPLQSSQMPPQTIDNAETADTFHAPTQPSQPTVAMPSVFSQAQLKRPATPATPEQPESNLIQRYRVFIVNSLLILLLIAIAIPLITYFRSEKRPEISFLQGSGPEQIQDESIVEQQMQESRVPALTGGQITIVPLLFYVFGGILVIPTYLAFLIAALQDGIFKGLFFFCCSCYAVWYVLLEYKSQNKWLYVAIFIAGQILLSIARLMSH